MKTEEDVKIPTQAELERELPQPPNDDPRPLLRWQVVLLSAVLALVTYVSYILGWWGNSQNPYTLPKEDFQKQKSVRIETANKPRN